MKRINARSNDELNILLDALIDYEILCRLYELTSNDHSYSRSILLLAMEKLYYAINLGQFPDHNIGILSLISTVNNIHLFDKRLFIEKPSIKKAFNNFLLYSMDKLLYDLYHIKNLFRVFRRFVYFLDHFKLPMPESLKNNNPIDQSIDDRTYAKHFAHWFAACVLPTYAKWFVNYCIRLKDDDNLFKPFYF